MENPDKFFLIRQNNIFLFSLLFNSLLLAIVLIFLTPTLGLDDVYLMLSASGFFTGEPSEYLLINHVFLGKLFQWLYSSYPIINWYSFLLMALNFICMTTILYLFLKKSNSYVSIFAFLLIFITFGIEFYIRLHYTFIAFLCGFTALFLLIFKNPGKKRFGQILYHLFVLLLFIMAFLVRKESFYGIFAFALLIIIYEFFVHHNLKYALVIITVVAIGFVLKFFDANYYEKNFDQNFSKYFEAQYVLNTENKISQDINPGILTKYGWTENDLALINGWFWVDQDVFNQTKLIHFVDEIKRIKNIRESINTLVREIITKPPSFKYFLFLLLLIIITRLNKESRTRLYITIANVIMVCILLVVFKNLNYRVLRPVWFFLITINLLYFLSHQSVNELMLNKLKKHLVFLVAGLTILAGIAVINHQNDMNRQLRKSFEGAFYEINQHPDKVFVFRTIYEVYGFPAFTAPQQFSSKNVIISDWFTYSPVYYQILKYHQVKENLMKEILQNRNYYIVNSAAMENTLIQFYLDHYDLRVCFNKSHDFKNINVHNISVCDADYIENQNPDK